MGSGTVEFRAIGKDRMECVVSSPKGRRLTLTGEVIDIEPNCSGDEVLARNVALVHNAWSFAKHESLYRRLRNVEKRASHAKEAKAYAKTAQGIAGFVDRLKGEIESGWCSACFAYTEHEIIDMGFGGVPAYLCHSCGAPTLWCPAPGCPHMATRGFDSIVVPRFCAEHRHDIPSFTQATANIGALENYADFLTFDKANLSRGSRVAGVVTIVAGVAATGGFLAAPAVGGAVGTLVGGYSGAAASSYGLALLGMGSVAAGGFGMVGGTAVVAALGGALGGALGASVTTAYIGDDKSFGIDKMVDGNGPPVIVASGFLTQGGDSWNDWRSMIHGRYPDSPVYRLRWGSKELATLAAFAGVNVGKVGMTYGLRAAAAGASRAGAKIGRASCRERVYGLV